MKRLCLVAATLCGLSVAAHAAEQKPAGWFAYQPGPQTCHQESPTAVIAYIRKSFHVDPDVDDTTDDTDRVVSTVITWAQANGLDSWEIHLFRGAEACEDYARSRRSDLHKYD